MTTPDLLVEYYETEHKLWKLKQQLKENGKIASSKESHKTKVEQALKYLTTISELAEAQLGEVSFDVAGAIKDLQKKVIFIENILKKEGK